MIAIKMPATLEGNGFVAGQCDSCCEALEAWSILLIKACWRALETFLARETFNRIFLRLRACSI